MLNNHFKRTALCLALLAALGGCGKKPQEEAAPASAAVPASPAPASPAGALEAKRSAAPAPSLAAAPRREAADKAMPAEPAATSNETRITSNALAGHADGARKFIRSANARFGVKDVYRSALSIEDAVAAQGGFVVHNSIASNVTDTRRFATSDGKAMEFSQYTVEGSLTVRVPSERTQEFLRAIAGEIEFLDQRGFEARDAQFDMLRQQLDYIRQQETQTELGQAEKSGGRLDQRQDIIAARDSAKAGRDEALIAQKMFDDEVAFSTIHLSIYQPARIRQLEVADMEETVKRNSPGLFPRLTDALLTGWNGLMGLIVGLVRVWPLWIVAGVAASFARRLKKKPQPTQHD